MTRYLPDLTNIANEPLALSGLLGSIALVLSEVAGLLEGVDTYVQALPLLVLLVARLFVDGPNTNS